MCLGYSPLDVRSAVRDIFLRRKTRKFKPKFYNFPVFRFCPIFYMLFIDIKSQLFHKNYFCCNLVKLNLYYDWTGVLKRRVLYMEHYRITFAGESMLVPVIFVNRCRNTSNSARIKIIGKIVFVLFLFYTQIVPLPKMIFSLGYVLLVPFMILS